MIVLKKSVAAQEQLGSGITMSVRSIMAEGPTPAANIDADTD